VRADYFECFGRQSKQAVRWVRHKHTLADCAWLVFAVQEAVCYK